MIDAHRGAFEYDWRARFHLPLRVVGGSMSWGEALRLFRVLATDPSSCIAAALRGWQHPVSREALALFDLFDLEHKKAVKRPTPYPRPWVANERKSRGRGVSREELATILAAARGDA